MVFILGWDLCVTGSVEWQVCEGSNQHCGRFSRVMGYIEWWAQLADLIVMNSAKWWVLLNDESKYAVGSVKLMVSIMWVTWVMGQLTDLISWVMNSAKCWVLLNDGSKYAVGSVKLMVSIMWVTWVMGQFCNEPTNVVVFMLMWKGKQREEIITGKSKWNCETHCKYCTAIRCSCICIHSTVL